MRLPLRPPSMPRESEFSERQFELAVNLELLAGSAGPPFSVPSLQAEKNLGYDIAMVPALPSIWGLLGRAWVPQGFRGWSAEPPEPPFAASLFIQYKCAESLVGSGAGQVSARERLCRSGPLPYFRYELKRPQLDQLIQLSRAAGSQAEVCYAAPAFTGLGQLHHLQMTRFVVNATDFLPVPEVDAFLRAYAAAKGKPRSHVWTYRGAGEGGVICSEPAPLESVGGEALLRVLREDWLREPRPVTRHLLEMEEVVAGWERELDTGDRPPLEHEPQMPPAMAAAAEIQGRLERNGLAWLLALAWPEGMRE